jgi:hypothetical protein
MHVASGEVSERYETGRRNQSAGVRETHEDTDTQFRSAGHIAHQVPHPGNERTHHEHPAAQVLKPVLDALNLLVIDR